MQALCTTLSFLIFIWFVYSVFVGFGVSSQRLELEQLLMYDCSSIHVEERNKSCVTFPRFIT
jgi:hypothetical protein